MSAPSTDSPSHPLGPVPDLGFEPIDYGDAQVIVHATVPHAFFGRMAIGMVRVDEEGIIVNIEVEENYRRRGVATALIRYLEAEGVPFRHDDWEFLSADARAWVQSLSR
jgi:GNAT superfamily N-acetyltransferase